MNEKVTIAIEKREKAAGNKGKKLRTMGYVPGAINRKGLESVSVKIKNDELMKNVLKYGKNYLFTLDLEGQESYDVLIKEMQHSPIKRELLNVVFQQVSVTEKIKFNLNLKIVGKEALEFRKLHVVQQMEKILVSGLPQDIPDFIEIDVKDLNLDDKICVGDLKFPEGIETEFEADKIVLVINESRSDDTITEELEE
ncbi:50S ribosomal protein L25 [Acetobacterium wieringae]|jgi:large subunit ribosomal protein L25|uniref:Large ribosomal subunit protein bL25 n=1 Tax=Acetobacterium wieringae TaxID=52694 RepID=A0A5D0WQZ6_9FIRM|nr:50S ribosomal protein L25 [Acetobacterium wieringae]MDD3308243.1 50S ribosomal protein L25 [Acetobacterium sp.]TYC86181.1 50S ribosomal protein L25 [Acetobacterium wieringae]UYO62763.1 50S ribosomal protein L25 [Acetobacterium wieringae]VUZ26602.1 General stress protein CTC [Acetobacterium wieringae]